MKQEKIDKINKILEMREDKKTLKEIGEVFGVTRERIRQIEAMGLEIRRQKEKWNNI